MKIDMKRIPINIYFITAFVFIFSWIFVNYYVSHEQNVYLWDYKYYWKVWEHFSKLLANDPQQWFAEIKAQVKSADYNPLPIVTLFPFYYAIRESRLAYILALSLFYLIPLVFIINFFVRKAFSLKGAWSTLFIITVCITFTAFWKPTLRGLPDIVGLIPISLYCIYILRENLTEKFSLSTCFILGLLSWSPFLLRRWYAYTIVAMYCSTFIYYFLVNYKDLNIKKIAILLSNIFVSGIFVIGFTFLFQKDLLVRVIFTDYSSLYAAYQQSVYLSIMSLYNYMGAYLLPFVFSGVVFAIFQFRKKDGAFVIFCMLNFIISFLLFTNTQAPGIHHILPFAFWLLIIFIYSLFSIIRFVGEVISRFIFVIMMLFCWFAFAHTFIPQINKVNIYDFIFPQKLYPLKVDNYNEYNDLINDIKNLTSHGEKISILSSNGILSDDLLLSISNDLLKDNIVFASQVDMRDKLNFNIFQSEYVVVPTTPQTHLNPDDQMVITIPAKVIVEKRNIGNAYKVISRDYKLSDGVIARIYKKTRPFTTDEVDALLKPFYDKYPDWYQFYQNGLYIPFITSEVTVKPINSHYSLNNEGQIMVFPGGHPDMELKISFPKGEKIKISSINKCDISDGVDIIVNGQAYNIKNGGEILLPESIINNDLSLRFDYKANYYCDELNIVSSKD